MAQIPSSRRRFLLQAAAAATVAPLLARMAWTPARADALKKLPLDDGQAKVLHYTEDATTVKDTLFKPGSNCANCQLFIAATGGCEIFEGYRVEPKGWCTAWAK